jgi:hypothetical protein
MAWKFQSWRLIPYSPTGIEHRFQRLQFCRSQIKNSLKICCFDSKPIIQIRAQKIITKPRLLFEELV